MVRRPMFTRALALLIGLPVLLLAPGAEAAPAREPGPVGTPLVITIDSLTPGVIPDRGPVRVRGRVTNRTDEPWTDVRLYPFIGNTGPIVDRAGLAEAAATPPDAAVGTRMVEVDDSVDVLQPGSSSTFSITVPRDLISTYISGAPGVYWFGVHAIGASASVPRDDFNDGRARTFLPLVPPRTQGVVPTALVVPLRRYLGREPDGRLADPDAWQRTLGPEGRLRQAVEFGAAAAPGRLSYLVDPALPDAVSHLAEGNPPRSLAPTIEPEEPGDTPSPSPTDDGADREEQEEDAEPLTAEQEVAASWLAELEPVLRSQQLLTLPYGDLDLAAAADHDPALIELADAQVGATLDDWDLPGSPVVGSPSGFLDAGAIDATDDSVPVLLSDHALPEDPPGVADLDGRKLVVASSGASAGGPAPGDPFGPVALRQRILAEGALRVLDPGRRDPLVVVMPAGLTSRGAEDFFAGLEVDWLDLTTLTDATDRVGPEVDADDLVYPDRQARLELDPETFQAVDDLITAGESLQNLLTLNDRIGADLVEEALAGASFTARQAQSSSRAVLNRSRGWVQDRLRSVEIAAPPGVTLSSDTGDFVATVTNRLDEPVTVGVRAVSDDGIAITPEEPVELAPRSRASVLLHARTSEAAVHNVTLLLTDTDGTPLGSSDRLPIRSAQVSDVIWLIMGTGVVLLFGTIGLRLVRRLRHRNEPATTT